MLDACGGSGGATTSTRISNAAASVFGVSGGYRFAMVNQLINDTLFTPTQNGAADACKLLGCSYEWTGSSSGNAQNMVAGITTAVGAGVDGIATSLIAPALFDTSVSAALDAGIPVVAYNSDDPTNPRLAYIGTDPLRAGIETGKRIRSLLPGGVNIMVFISSPGAANLQPRLDGIRQALQGTGIKVHSQASGTSSSQQVTTVDAIVGAHMAAYRGYFAVDGGSTAALGQAIQKYGLDKRGVVGGGFDVTPPTAQLLQSRVIQFAIDEQPYLQGFLAILQLFMYKASQGLTGPADVDTGVRFVDPSTVARYVNTSSRYEATSDQPGVQHS